MGVTTTPTVVFVDADNTLWDTDKVYAEAQLGLLSGVEKALGIVTLAADRLGFVRMIDQAIAEHHHAGLRYPPRLLAKALAHTLKGSPPQSAARRAARDSTLGRILSEVDAVRIETIFSSALRTLPPLRPGVREGLVALRKMGSAIFIITEGERDRILHTAQAHNLDDLFDRIIEAPKRPQLYERALRLVHGSSSVFMIGDQLNRDIGPASEAGLRTIYFPGGFRPQWEPDEKAVRPDFRIDSFDRVPEIVAGGGVNAPE